MIQVHIKYSVWYSESRANLMLAQGPLSRPLTVNPEHLKKVLHVCTQICEFWTLPVSFWLV